MKDGGMDDKKVDRSQLKSEVMGGFSAGRNCAESLVLPFAAALGQDSAMIMKMATPFGAGIGGRRDLCGMITGGTLIIGLAYGRTSPTDAEQKSLAYKKAADYYRWFKERQQVKCSEIVRGKFSGHTEDCVKLLAEAQAKLAEVIWGEDNDSA